MSGLFNKVLYVVVTAEKLTVRNAGNGKQVYEAPEAAVESQPKLKLLGVGAEARRLASHPGVKLVNPFVHPRTLVGDFTLAELVLKGFVARVKSGGILNPMPKMVIHLPADPEGGYTQVELRVFRELGFSAGARKITLWQGRALSDAELLSGEFPAGGRILE